MLKLGRYTAEIDDQTLMDILASGVFIKIKKTIAFVHRRKIFVVEANEYYNTHIVKYTLRVPFANYTIPKYHPEMTHVQNVARLKEILSISKRQEICGDVAMTRMNITKRSFSQTKAKRTLLVEQEEPKTLKIQQAI